MFVDYATPGLGITRIRFNGYNLSRLFHSDRMRPKAENKKHPYVVFATKVVLFV